MLNSSQTKTNNIKPQHFFLLGNETILFLGFITLFGLFAIWLGQDISWDLRNYHFYNPYAFLHHRFDRNIAPAHMQTFYNPLFDLITYFIIHYFSRPQIVEFLLGAFDGVAVYFLFKVAFFAISTEKKIWRYFYIALATILGATSSANLPQIGTTHNESEIAAFILAAVFLVLKYINDTKPKQIHFCLLSGLVLGLAVGFKLSAMSYAIAFFLALLFYKKIDFQHLKLVFITGIIFCISFLPIEGFWMLTLYKHFHNPLFPYYNNVFHSPYAPFDDFNDAAIMPHSFFSGLSIPFRWLHVYSVSQEAISFRDVRVALTIVLGILFAAKLTYQKLTNKLNEMPNNKSESYSTRFICLFFYLSFFIWVFQFSVYRFTVAIDLISGILIVNFCTKLATPTLWRNLLLIVLSLAILLFTRYPDWGRTRTYGKHFFEINVPAIPRSSMVILMGGAPVAYLIPYFPQDTRFVALDNYFVNKRTHAFQQLALDAINNHHGPLYVLVDSTDPIYLHVNYAIRGKRILRHFNLLRLDEMCRFVTSNLETKPMPLCAVIKINK